MAELQGQIAHLKKVLGEEAVKAEVYFEGKSLGKQALLAKYFTPEKKTTGGLSTPSSKAQEESKGQLLGSRGPKKATSEEKPKRMEILRESMHSDDADAKVAQILVRKRMPMQK